MKNKMVTLLAGAATAADLPFIKGDVIGIDRGAFFAVLHHIPLLAAIGDFDSVSKEEKQRIEDTGSVMIEHPAKKDASDTELALAFATKKAFKKIRILGVIGSRLDHFVAVMHALYRYPKHEIEVINATNHIQLLPLGKHRIAITHRYFSLLTLKETVISLLGAKYPVTNQTIQPTDTFALSNEPIKKFITITVKRAPVFLMQASDVV
jgi:thiamine pyrophosphokinase